MKKIVFITGATSGFGEACAFTFAAGNYHLILNGRKKDLLEALKEKLEQQFPISCLLAPFDVRMRDDVFNAVNTLPAEWQNIDVLVNNAGLALGRDLFQDGNPDDWDIMIDTNLKGLLYVSKAVVPLMTARKKGHIINIGSIAGKEVYEKGNVYCATKHSVDAVSKAMRMDLLPYRIKVTAIHPGAAETGFSRVRLKGDEAAAKMVYEGYQPLSAADVADVVFYTASLPEHVCINDLVITCTQQANSYLFDKYPF